MKKPGKLTKYQLELMQHLRAADAGVLDFDELLDRLSWTPTKEAAQFSVRALIKRGLVAKLEKLQLRRGRLRVCFQLTRDGLLALDPRLAAPLDDATLAAGEPQASTGTPDVEPPGRLTLSELLEATPGMSAFLEEEFQVEILEEG